MEKKNIKNLTKNDKKQENEDKMRARWNTRAARKPTQKSLQSEHRQYPIDSHAAEQYSQYFNMKKTNITMETEIRQTAKAQP